MNWFKNLKIRAKLFVSFIMMAAVAAVIGITGIITIRALDAADTVLYEHTTAPLGNLLEIASNFQRVRVMTRDILLESDPSAIDNSIKAIDDLRAKVGADSKEFESKILSDDVHKAFDHFKETRVAYGRNLDQLYALARANKDDEGFALLKGEMKRSAVAEEEAINRVEEETIKAAKAANAENDRLATSSTLIMFLIMAAGVLSAIGLGIFISRLISRPVLLIAERIEQLKGLCVTNLGNGLNALAAGDVDYRVETGTQYLNMDTKDEVGDLSRSIDAIIKQTRASVDSFQQSRDILKDVLGEIGGLIKNAKDGDLSSRGNAAKFKGTYKNLIDGFNDTITAFVVPVQESSDVLKQMSSGDMSVRMTGEYKGDFLVMKESVNQLGESLDTALMDVAEAVSATASASNEISSSTEQMAAGAQEQTQQASEVAAAVDQMTKTIMETTRNAADAAETAKQSGVSAREGGSVVKETIDGMNRIADVVKTSAQTVMELGKSSDQIGEIVQVIDDIADQTNLLALNAAIEAARAGEQGRGFAVVADEVRKLAERTTKATKEIAQMIKQIQKDTGDAVSSMQEGTNEVERGRILAEKSGHSLAEIITGSQKVVDAVTQVAGASEEQSSAAEQIGKNIEAISSVTAESAAGTQQIARAAEDLNRLTTNLQDLLSKFSLSGGGRSSDGTHHRTALSAQSKLAKRRLP